jgi:hypothetical protein
VTFPIARPIPKFGQKLDFIGRMTRWADALDRPTLLVGDFNIAPLECDVYDHKALLKVVSHTPIEIETLGRLSDAHGWVDLGRKHIPAPSGNWTWWSYRTFWQEKDRGRRLDHMWAFARPRQAVRYSHRFVEGNATLGPAFGPRAADHGVRSLSKSRLPATPSGARRVALAIDALRHGWPIMVGGTLSLLPAETGFRSGREQRQDADFRRRAVTLKLANQREAAVPEAPVLIRAAEPFDLPGARAVADPALDLLFPMKGPFAAEHLDRPEAAKAATGTGAARRCPPRVPRRPRPSARRKPFRPKDLAEWKDLHPPRYRARARGCPSPPPRTPRSLPSARPTTCASMLRWLSASRTATARRLSGSIPNA